MATKTIAITNFGGRLTRIINGDMNSGFAQFDTSWGYDPFTKPGNLTWLETPSSITGIEDVVMGGITRTSDNSQTLLNAYLVGNTGKLYQIEVRNPITGLSTGELPPSSVALLNISGRTWTSPSSIYALDGMYASYFQGATSPSFSNYIVACNFGFNVPTDAEIQGITANIYRGTFSAGGAFRDNSVKLTKSLAVVGDDKAVNSSNWPSASVGGTTYGSGTDLWGTTWTPAEVNDPGFGLALSARVVSGVNPSAQVDYMSLAVSYVSPSADSIIGISSVTATFNYGAGMSFFGSNEQLYLGSDSKILRVGSVVGGNDFTIEGPSSVVAEANVVGKSHPLKRFSGKLIFGNGPSIGAVDNTGTVVSSVFTVSNYLGPQFSQLFPALPADQQVRDLDQSVDANYLNISAASIPPENLTQPGADTQVASPGEGGIYGWNGVEPGVTTFKTVPSGTSTALQVYLQNNLIFLNDAFGTSVSDGVTKLLTLTNNKSPVPNATTVNGNFLSWMAPEFVTSEGTRPASLYYFGALDEQNPAGLYRLLRHYPFEQDLPDGYAYQVPYNSLVTSKYSTVNASITGVNTISFGKHFFSTYNVSSTISSPSATGAHSLYRFFVTPTGFGTALEGVYETQTQLFSKRISVSQVRVYCEPTDAGNSFDLYLVGADRRVLNDPFSYSFGEIADPQSDSLNLERINFNCNIKTQYSLGVRIVNTGPTNMTIKKIELDISEEGK